jgi:hypothetical protein
MPLVRRILKAEYREQSYNNRKRYVGKFCVKFFLMHFFFVFQSGNLASHYQVPAKHNIR